MTLQTTLAAIGASLMIGGFTACFDTLAMNGSHLVDCSTCVGPETQPPLTLPTAAAPLVLRFSRPGTR